ncbi:nucleoside monophosphate kinase, partial [Methylicorpusculum sp.]|uniref:adenylate kinase family protein n=1 Tax=Methylicorpusculum sp. TaxID=2713644 RepID=UPI002ABAFC5F
MNSSTRNIVLVVLVAVVGVGLFYSHKQFIAKKSAASSVVAPKTILAFLGAPGSGKGTLAKQAVTQLHFTSLSTGDLCRAEVASGSEKGKMIAEYMKGGLIPDQVMTEMVESWLNAHAGTEPIILDGYPRTKDQAVMLADLLKTKFADYKFGVVSLTITNEEEVVQRIANRLVCEQCKTVHSRTK